MPYKDKEKQREYQREYLQECRRLGLCEDCKAKAVDGNHNNLHHYCFYHKEKRRLGKKKYYENNKDMVASRRKQKRRKHIESGLCYECDNKALPHSLFCGLHRERYIKKHREFYYKHADRLNKEVRERQEKYTREGKCSRCGVPLIEGEGKICMNCIEAWNTRGRRIIQGVLYATNNGRITIRP